jgi:multidrug efflux pump subunit AcrA (membrane-fusion protein)
MKNVNRLPALLAAFGITSVIGIAILAIGANALFNRYSAPAQSTSPAIVTAQATSDETLQLQDMVTQYDSQLSQANIAIQQYQTQLSQASNEIQQYQALLTALQQQGVISINSDGTISIPRGNGTNSFPSGHDD